MMNGAAQRRQTPKTQRERENEEAMSILGITVFIYAFALLLWVLG